MKKDEGFIQYVLCILLISIVALIVLFQCRARVIEAQKETIEDAVTLSALSSSLIDLNEYGRYGYIRSGSNNVFDDEEWAMLKVFKENSARFLYQKVGFEIYEETTSHFKMRRLLRGS